MRRAIRFLAISAIMAAMLWAAPSIHSIVLQRSSSVDGRSQQEREMEDRQQQEANKKRQEEIRQEAQQLFDLASQLKDAVNKSNENLLSLDVVRKAEEVEKLARRVKEKMREGSGKPLKTDQKIELLRPPH